MNVFFYRERELKFDATKPVKHVRFLAFWFRDAPVHESRCLVAHCPFIIVRGRERGKAHFISTDDFQHRTGKPDLALIYPNAALAKTTDLVHLVANEHNRPATLSHFVHFTETLPLKFEIPDGQHLVNEKYLRFKMCRDGKS